MRIFISVGMHNREYEDVRREIERLTAYLAFNYDNPIEIVHNLDCVAPEGADRLWYLGEAIKKLGTCDVAYFIKGWDKYRGCRIEKAVCDEYKITSFEASFDVDVKPLGSWL